jgi:predicted sulfurtransferase
LPEALKDQAIVTFCTGGIRCEKAAPWLISQGFREVYQLEGGILNYFAQCGGAHFRGECFVFDQRVALDAGLRQTGAATSRGAWHEPG